MVKQRGNNSITAVILFLLSQQYIINSILHRDNFNSPQTLHHNFYEPFLPPVCGSGGGGVITAIINQEEKTSSTSTTFETCHKSR